MGCGGVGRLQPRAILLSGPDEEVQSATVGSRPTLSRAPQLAARQDYQADLAGAEASQVARSLPGHAELEALAVDQPEHSGSPLSERDLTRHAHTGCRGAGELSGGRDLQLVEARRTRRRAGLVPDRLAAGKHDAASHRVAAQLAPCLRVAVIGLRNEAVVRDRAGEPLAQASAVGDVDLYGAGVLLVLGGCGDDGHEGFRPRYLAHEAADDRVVGLHRFLNLLAIGAVVATAAGEGQ